MPEWGKISWRRKRQPTPVFLPGKSHGWRSLVGYSLWDCKRVGQNVATKQEQQTFPQKHYRLEVNGTTQLVNTWAEILPQKAVLNNTLF